jgi:tRNA G37 N-methylase Trm5
MHGNKDKTSLLVFDEIYLMRIYGKPNLENRVVIDVGASIGDTTLFFCKCGAKVYGYEISKARYDIAIENVRLNNLQDKVILFNDAATAKNVNDLIEKEGLDGVFLKVDCEGCEYELLPKINLTRINDIIMEYHGTPNLLLDIMKKEGFKTRLNRKEITIYATMDHMHPLQ